MKREPTEVRLDYAYYFAGSTSVGTGVPLAPRGELQRPQSESDGIPRMQAAEFLSNQLNEALPVLGSNGVGKQSADHCRLGPCITADDGRDERRQLMAIT